MKNIIDKIEDYFSFQMESFGNDLLIDLDKNIKQEQDVVIMNTNITKQVIPKEEIKSNVEFKPIKQVIDSQKQKEDEISISTDWFDSDSLEVLNSKICNCLECKLGHGRQNFVFGSGNPKADIMVIGEAPGADEDEQGLPFVGRAGQLLTKILESINLRRDEVYIANIVKCRPPNNRRPDRDEVDQCERYLKKQIELINPQFILSLGLTSVDTLLKKNHKMAEIRGNLLNYENRKMLVTYHPAALLRNPNWKKFVWEDVKYLRKIYDEYLNSIK